VSAAPAAEIVRATVKLTAMNFRNIFVILSWMKLS